MDFVTDDEHIVLLTVYSLVMVRCSGTATMCLFASLARVSKAPYTGVRTAMVSFALVKAPIHHMIPVMTLGALVSLSCLIAQLWRCLYQCMTASIYFGFVMV